LDIILLLERRGARVSYSDPHIPSVRLNGHGLNSEDPEKCAEAADCVVIVTDHRAFDYAMVVEKAKLILDTRNALKSYRAPTIVRL
jgi:UDP-N-acetyl-D-glucosamine dehydrogenase